MSEEEYIQKAYERLHRKETDEIVEYAYALEQELKVLKEKEDKLREYCNEQGKDMTKLESIFTGEETKEYVLLNGFLQILNEGGKE